MNRQIALASIGGILTLVVLYFTLSWFFVGQYEMQTDNAYVRADITLISAKSDAYVRSIDVADNSKVKAGTVLVQLDPQDVDARLSLAQANLAQAEANLAKARAQAGSSVAAVRSAEQQIVLQNSVIGEARAAAVAAQANREVAAADRGRFASLAQRGFVSPARLDTADAAAKASSAALAQANAAIAAQSAQIGVLQAARDRSAADASAANASVGSAQAAVDAARAALQSAQNDKGYTSITAPIGGLVANRTVQNGQLVRPGTVLMALVPLSQAYVVANFKETQIQKLLPGQKVTFKVDAFPSLKVTGKLESVSPASGSQFSLLPTDTATGNFTKITQRVPVRIAIDEEWRLKELLRPGMSVVATVDLHPLAQQQADDPKVAGR